MKYGLSSPPFSGQTTGFYRSAHSDTDFHAVTISNFTQTGPNTLTSGDFVYVTVIHDGTGSAYLKLSTSGASDAASTAIEIKTGQSLLVEPGTIIGSTISYKKSNAGDDLQIVAGFGDLI